MADNKLQTQEQSRSVKSLLGSETVQQKLREILGKNASTFATSVVQITTQNAMLAKAEPSSVVGAAMTAATLNLPLNQSLGYAYIVPFGEKQPDGSYLTKAQFQIGYKGFIQLAMRSGQFKTIHASDVRKGEIASRDRLTGEMDFQWIEDDNKRNNTPLAGYVAYFRLLNGYEATYFQSIEELNAHGKKYSQTFKKNKGLWATDFDSMARKTVLKTLLSKYAPLSIEMQTAVETDQAAFNDVDEPHDISYVDNQEPEHDHEGERIRVLVEGIENEDDIEFVRPHVTEKYLPLFKEKVKEVNEKKIAAEKADKKPKKNDKG